MGQELVLIGPLCMVLSSMDNGQDDRTQLGASDSNSRHTAPPINVFDIDIDIGPWNKCALSFIHVYIYNTFLAYSVK